MTTTIFIGKCRYVRTVGRNFQRGVRRHASRVAHLAAGGLGALSDPQKTRGIWSKIISRHFIQVFGKSCFSKFKFNTN